MTAWLVKTAEAETAAHPELLTAAMDLAFSVGRHTTDEDFTAVRLLKGIVQLMAASGGAVFDERLGVPGTAAPRPLRRDRWTDYDSFALDSGVRTRPHASVYVERLVSRGPCRCVTLVADRGRAFYLTASKGAALTIALRRVVRPFSDDDAAAVRSILDAKFTGLLSQPPPHARSAMAPRIREVLACLTNGRAEKEMAEDLGISQHTVHTYVKRIYRLYGVSSRAELLSRFIHHADETPGP